MSGSTRLARAGALFRSRKFMSALLVFVTVFGLAWLRTAVIGHRQFEVRFVAKDVVNVDGRRAALTDESRALVVAKQVAYPRVVGTNPAFEWENSLLIFLHVPKTAGSVVKQILMDWGKAVGMKVAEHTDRFLNFTQEEQDKHMAFWGHRGYGMHRRAGWKTKKIARYFTFLRDPVKRIISQYEYHYHETGTPKQPFMTWWEQGGGREHVGVKDYASPWYPKNNPYIRQVCCWWPPPFVKDAGRAEHCNYNKGGEQMNTLKCAQRNLHTFVMVGVQEHLDAGIELLLYRTGMRDLRTASQLVANVFTGRKKYQMSPEEGQSVKEAAAYDISLYDYCVRLFEQQYALMKAELKIRTKIELPQIGGERWTKRKKRNAKARAKKEAIQAAKRGNFGTAGWVAGSGGDSSGSLAGTSEITPGLAAEASVDVVEQRLLTLSKDKMYAQMAKGIVALKWRTPAESSAFADLEMCRNMAVIELQREKQIPLAELQASSSARLLAHIMHLVGEREAEAVLLKVEPAVLLPRLVAGIVTMGWRPANEAGLIEDVEAARNIGIIELSTTTDMKIPILQGMSNAALLVTIEALSGIRVPVSNLEGVVVLPAAAPGGAELSGAAPAVAAPAAALSGEEATEADFDAIRAEIAAAAAAPKAAAPKAAAPKGGAEWSGLPGSTDMY